MLVRLDFEFGGLNLPSHGFDADRHMDDNLLQLTTTS